MSALTNFLEAALLNHVFRNTSFASPSSIWVALHTGDPGEVGNQNELAGNGYTRVQATFSAPTDSGDGFTEVSNNSAVAFPAATGAWGTVTHFSLWSAQNGGNPLWKGQLDEGRTIAATDEPRFASGALVVKLG